MLISLLMPVRARTGMRGEMSMNGDLRTVYRKGVLGQIVQKSTCGNKKKKRELFMNVL